MKITRQRAVVLSRLNLKARAGFEPLTPQPIVFETRTTFIGSNSAKRSKILFSARNRSL